MVRILTSGARLIDIDFSEIQFNYSRTGGSPNATGGSTSRAGTKQLLNSITTGQNAGSFIQYQRIDLDFMVKNGEMLQPTSVTIQRTSPVPLGSTTNGNLADQIEEYILVLSRPLATDTLENLTGTQYESLRRIGLDGCDPVVTALTPAPQGRGAGWPNRAQTIYAEKRMYDINLNNIASVTNGQLSPDPVLNPDFWSLGGMPSLANVSSWGSLGDITGPNLHCYRIVIDRRQNVIPNFSAYTYAGSVDSQWPAVNISFIAEDPAFTSGEYITRLANAMTSMPLDAPTN